MCYTQLEAGNVLLCFAHPFKHVKRCQIAANCTTFQVILFFVCVCVSTDKSNDVSLLIDFGNE